jgi:hypothetical protein
VSPCFSCSTKPRSVCTGPPKNTGCSASSSLSRRELDLLEQVLQLDVDGLVDHQAQRAVLGVLAEVDHRARKVSSPMPGMAIRNWLVRFMREAADMPGF